MDEQDAIAQGLELIEKSKIAMLGTNGECGFPNIKAMLNLRHEGIRTFWFSTNTSSRRVRQLRQDNRACIYFVDENEFRGLMLVGVVDILQDIESRKMLWNEGYEMYYPRGVEDPDYSVLRFAARQGNYYHGLDNVTFDIGLQPGG
jgi:general stress protein 26